jgi:hypothetical protein
VQQFSPLDFRTAISRLIFPLSSHLLSSVSGVKSGGIIPVSDRPGLSMSLQCSPTERPCDGHLHDESRHRLLVSVFSLAVVLVSCSKESKDFRNGRARMKSVHCRSGRSELIVPDNSMKVIRADLPFHR